MAAAAFEDHFANLQSIPTADKQMEFLITLPVPALEAIISSCAECYASLASIALLEKKKSMKFVHIHVFLDDGWKASSTFSGNSDSSDNVYLKELAFTGSPTAAMKSSASSLNSIQDAEIVDFLTKVNTIDFKISVEDADFELQ